VNKDLIGLPPRPHWSDVMNPGGAIFAQQGSFVVQLIPNQNGSITPIVNREYLIGFSIWVPTRIIAFGFACSGVGTEAAKAQFAVRAMRNDGFPGEILAVSETTDCTSATGTGSKWCQINLEVRPGRYCVCFLGTGWTTTGPTVRQSTTGSGDQVTYSYELPRVTMLPQSVSTALPTGGNTGLSSMFRNGPAFFLWSAMRDWSSGPSTPAIYMQGEPL
jgi:hypothetical protein